MTTATMDEVVPVRTRTAPPRIGFGTVLGVELRKMFDTRSGFWLMASIVILSAVATSAVIIFAPDQEVNYENFATAIGFPMSVILPMIAILAVTSEWSQRGGLTTFTLVPSRTRVIAAKLLLTLVIGALGMLVAGGVGALGNIGGSALAGVDTTWNVTWTDFAKIILANEIGMVMGFALGVLIRSSPGAIVGYFVFSLVLPGISQALMAANDWWHDQAHWFDLNVNTTMLYDQHLTSQDWAHLGITTMIWVLLPLTVGLRLAIKREIK